MPNLGGSGYSWDDYIMIFTYVMDIMVVIATELTLANGSGLDEWRLTPREISRYMLVSIISFGRMGINDADIRLVASQWTYISEILYNTIIMTTKIAVVLLYLRMFETLSSHED